MNATELAIVITAKDLSSGVLEGVSKKFGGLGEAGKLAVAGIAALATASVAVGTAMVGFAESAAKSADEVRKLARETGLSAEEASKLRYAGERLNIDTDQLSKGFGIFSKTIETNTKKLDEYGISVFNNADGTVNLGETVKAVAEKFKEMPDGVEKTNLSMQLFGKSGKDLIPLLNQGSKGLYDMGEEAAKLGLVFSKEGVESARQFGLAQKDLGDRFEGMKNTIGLKVLPVLTNLFDFLSGIADKVLPPITEMFGHLVEILGEVFGVLSGKAPDAGAALKAAIGPDAAKIVMGALAGIRDTAKEVFQKVGDFVQLLKDHWDVAGPAIAAMALFVIVPALVGLGVAATGAVLALLPVLIPLALIGGAVALLAYAWTTNFADIQTKTGDAINFILDIFDGLHIAALLIWRAILTGIAGIINGVIGVINGFIEAYDNVAEKLHLPILGKIELVTPNLDQINADINEVARARNARITVTTEYIDPLGPGGRGRSFDVGTTAVPYTGPAIVHKDEAIIPAAQNPFLGRGNWGDGHEHTIVINLDGDTIATVVGRRYTQARRNQGLA